MIDAPSFTQLYFIARSQAMLSPRLSVGIVSRRFLGAAATVTTPSPYSTQTFSSSSSTPSATTHLARRHDNAAIISSSISSGSTINASFRHHSNPSGRTILSRQYNFASTPYASCFQDIPTADGEKLRKEAVSYLDSFDKQSWYTDPVSR